MFMECGMFIGLWHGVVSAMMEGVAPCDASEREPCALDGAIFLNGLECVGAACGSEPAVGAEVWRDGELVEPNGGEEGVFGEGVLVACHCGGHGRLRWMRWRSVSTSIRNSA